MVTSRTTTAKVLDRVKKVPRKRATKQEQKKPKNFDYFKGYTTAGGVSVEGLAMWSKKPKKSVTESPTKQAVATAEPSLSSTLTTITTIVRPTSSATDTTLGCSTLQTPAWHLTIQMSLQC